MIFTWSKEWASPIGRAMREPANQMQTITILDKCIKRLLPLYEGSKCRRYIRKYSVLFSYLAPLLLCLDLKG
jgi:hypothetical protein